MAPPNEPKSKAERELPPDSGNPTPHPRYEDHLDGDAFEVMRKYQVVTLPPNARLELMKMKLPEAPPELLQDTLPPNGDVKTPVAAVATEDGSTTDAPVVDDSHLHDTVIIPRVQRQKRLRSVVIGALVAGVALLGLGFLVARGGETRDSGSEQPAEVHVLPVNAAADQSPVAARPATPVPVLPSPEEAAPAAATSAKGADKQPTKPSVESHRTPGAAELRPGAVKPPAVNEPSKPATPTPTPKAPAAAQKSGSAFDGPMRPPSD